MSKTNCAWRFDKTPLKGNHFFSTCVTVGENSTFNILRSGNRILRLLGGSLLIHTKGVGTWRSWTKIIRDDETWRKGLICLKSGAGWLIKM